MLILIISFSFQRVSYMKKMMMNSFNEMFQCVLIYIYIYIYMMQTRKLVLKTKQKYKKIYLYIYMQIRKVSSAF